MVFNCIIFFASVFVVNAKSIPYNNTPIISTYAKVAHWGAVSTTTTEKPLSQARSHNGQTLWTHRSDVNIVSGQNLKPSKPKVIYQYPVHKVGQGLKESVPGVGEVQDRFNPRPYFEYTQMPPKQISKNNNKPKSKPDSTPPPTFDSFPVFNPPSPPSDLYSSQYSSYNPPIAGPINPPDDSKPDVAYPPNAPPPPDDNSNNDDDNDSNGYSYNPPQDSPPAPQGPPTAPSYPSLGPPLAPTDDDDDHKDQFYPPSSNGDQKNHGFYSPHDDDKEQVYFPPSEDGSPHETILDHPPPGWQDSKQNMAPPPPPPNMTPMMAPNMAPAMAPNMNGMNGQAMDGHDMAEHDLSPPPSPNFGGQFPPYLYNGPHDQAMGHDFDYNFDDHHVYKEVTTTTTEAPEDERVNKGHYSYYFLGRKLWYVPLYFSVYFIIYVTVLILKSIARHKIQFKHQHFHKGLGKDMGKDMNDDMMEHGRSLDIDDLHENVTRAIESTRRRFPTYIAM